MAATKHDRLAGVKHGALAGLVVGVILAVLAEAGGAITRSMAAGMDDVWIVGLTAVYGLPVSVAVGSLLGWWGRPKEAKLLAFAVAVPAGLVAIAQVAAQASAF